MQVQDHRSPDPLASFWEVARRTNHGVSLPHVAAWLRSAPRPKRSRWVWHGLFESPRFPSLRLVYTLGILLILTAASQVPIGYDLPVGHIISWTDTLPHTEAYSQLEQVALADALGWSVSTNRMAGTQTNTFEVIVAQTDADALASTLATLRQHFPEQEPAVQPLVESVQAPLYAITAHTLRLGLNTHLLEDDEILERLQAQLEAQGFSKAQIRHWRDEQNRHHVDVEIPPPTP